MAHHTARGAYRQLVDRLNAFPQGAPPSDLLYRILGLLFSEREASLVAQLPIRPFTAARAARIWRMGEPQARQILDELAGRAVLLDYENDGVRRWALPPPMAGFFEFSMMRLRDDVDQKLLAELFYQYITVEEDFIRELFTTGETQARASVRERERAAGGAGAARARLRARQRGDPLHPADGRRRSATAGTRSARRAAPATHRSTSA